MDPNLQVASALDDYTPADEGVILEPLRQEQHGDSSRESKTEGKKLTQYMAAVFGKYQVLPSMVYPTLASPRHYTCVAFY
jgi:hypothetical protein